MINDHPTVKLIECPRDAMQGIKEFIPTRIKIKYINQLLKVGFDTLDFGSFVSPAAIPQMKDTAEVLSKLELNNKTKLLAIVANTRGAVDALSFPEISYLGFPLSLSETFQKKNTNKTIEEAFKVVEEIQNLCVQKKRALVVYLSMGFGNPYCDPYDKDFIRQFVERLVKMDIKIISLADTIGASNKSNINYLFTTIIPAFPQVEFGAHLHSNPADALEKIEAAYNAGCRMFDGALKGYGGCPMAEDELVGNIATENLIQFFDARKALRIDKAQFNEALKMTVEVFPV